jgi:sporulation protein YlmC with PRC-barrel domain
MLSTDQIERLLSGGTVVTSSGEKIGKVGQVFLDDRTGEPEWVTVRTGLFGRSESFVPLADADVEGDEIRVPFGKDEVGGAPRVDDAEGHLSPEEERQLYRYYGRESEGTTSPGRDGHDDRGEREHRADEEGVVGKYAAGPSDDDASAGGDDDATAGGPGAGAPGTVRLRRYVVTEYVTQSAPGEQGSTGGDSAGAQAPVTKRVREEVMETGTDAPGHGTAPGEEHGR